jgi:hypothetical protein
MYNFEEVFFSPKKEGLWAKDAKNVGIGWRGI